MSHFQLKIILKSASALYLEAWGRALGAGFSPVAVGGAERGAVAPGCPARRLYLLSAETRS